MNVALRALHDGLRGPCAVASTWGRFAAAVERGCEAGRPIRGHDLDEVLRSLDLRASAAELLYNLRTLGVIGPAGTWHAHRAASVGTALELAADSFDIAGPTVTWAPVATLPGEVRHLLRPPPLRQTAGVMLELIDAAADELILATPFVDLRAVAAMSGSLASARRRGVDLAIVTSVGRGQSFAAIAMNDESDGLGGLRVTEVRTEVSPLGSHAKVLVVDRRRAYVGSANLTAAGLGRNVEIGVEVTGPQVEDLARLLGALERVGTRVPTNDF